MPDYQQTTARWTLSASRKLRLFTIFILYIAQGIPIGLFWFAIPAWMATNGADAQDIAWVLGLTALPWSLKFVNGFLMDRYAFLPMGRRRPWILGAQLIMVLVFLSAAVIQPTASDILLLGAIGFIGNAATTFQDVGVDGMAVDLLEEPERARGGGMMFGGQLIGTALATAGTGWAIMKLGASGAYLLAAVALLLVNIFVGGIRERPGERRFPWSPGEAHPINLQRHAGRWWPILQTTLRSLFLPASLFWVVIMLVKGAQYGVMAGVTPLIGVTEAGLSETQVTSLTGLAQLLAGVAGLVLGSWLGERLGAKWSTFALLVHLGRLQRRHDPRRPPLVRARLRQGLHHHLVYPRYAADRGHHSDRDAPVQPEGRRHPIYYLHGTEQSRHQPRHRPAGLVRQARGPDRPVPHPHDRQLRRHARHAPGPLSPPGYYLTPKRPTNHD